MFSPLHTHQASVLARLPAEPQYWMETLPVGHGKYNSGIFYSFTTRIHSVRL